MTEITASLLQNKIIFKRFKLRKLLYTSEFSWVYEGKNIVKNVPVAIKIEKKGKFNILESEAYILTSVKGFGIPEIISFGKYGPFKILVEEFLGTDIHNLWVSGPFKKDPFGQKNKYIKDICLFAIQGIERLKYIHDKNIIHRDIKTKNFITGRKDPEVIYLIDFGLAKKYRSSRTGKHIKFSNLKLFIGSMTFSSHNSIRGYESSRRDDLESFGYTLLYLAKGGWMPWTKYTNNNNISYDNTEKIIKDIKLKFSEEKLCKGLPNEFIDYMKYVKKLEFEQEPDYKYLTDLFRAILSKIEFKKNITFFWIKQKSKEKEKKVFENKENNISNEMLKNSRNNSLRALSLKRLYNKIKNSLINKTISNNYNTNRIITNSEKKINFKYKMFNTNQNDINNINNINNNNNSFVNNTFNIINTKREMPRLLTNKMNNYKPIANLNNIRNNRNKLLNMNNKNNASMLQKYNKISNNLIQLSNSSKNFGKNVTLYNNINYNKIYFIKKSPKVTKLNLNYFSILKNPNNVVKNKTPEHIFNDFNFKGNNSYRPLFKNYSNILSHKDKYI